MKKTLSLIIIASMLIAFFSGCGFFQQQGFEMNSKELTLTVGDSKVISVVPESANKKLTWSSSDENIVTVEAGTVKAKAAGSAVVTAASESGNSATCNVTVNAKEVKDITLNNQAVSVEAGKTVQLKATVTPADATNTKLSWSAENGAIAVVNDNGLVTGASEGVTNIICKADNGVEAKCTVTVTGGKKKTESSNESSGGQAYTYVYGHLNPNYVYRSSDFVFPESSSRQLSRAEIQNTLSGMVGSPVSSSFAQDAINEIYARNGYVFKDSSLKSYYMSKAWYYPDSSFTTSDFSSIESYNIKLLEDYS